MSSNTSPEHLLKNLDNKILDLLQKAYILVGPADEENQKAGSLQERLSLRLKQISVEREQQSEELTFARTSGRSVRENYVTKCLEILEDLELTLRSVDEIKSGQELAESNKLQEPDSLGVRDLRLVHTMLEIVVSWGIYPCLLPGVGIPISHRTRSGYIQNEFFEKMTSDDDDSAAFDDPLQKSRWLFRISRSLTSIVFPSSSKSISCTSVSSTIYRKHVTDIYAALLQLAYGPILSSNGQQELKRREAKRQLITVLSNENREDVVVGDKTPRDIELEEIRKDCISTFREIFERSDSFQSLEALTTLLASSPSHQPPKWLKNACGRYLTRVLLRPSGVKDVIEFMIGGDGEASLSKVEAISQLVLSVPNTAKSNEAYFSIICPQLLSIVQSDSTLLPNSNAKLAPPIVNVASLIIARMFSKFPMITKQFIITRIFGALWQWWGITLEKKNQISRNYNPATDLDPLIMDEQTLQSTITVIHRLLVGSEPIPDLLQFFLQDSVAPLYYLYSFTCTSKSFLKDIVMDILLTYFKIVSVSEGVETFKEIVFRKNKRLRPPDVGEVGEVYFSPGPSGGAVMRSRMTAANSPVTATTLDVNLFIDFVKSISRNELSGDLFMYLLTEYTSSRSVRLQESNPRR
ncbi:10650_t:CDS:2 [Acaulospora colombiana]|uniref:10650_t:CDS:1 n=1 Tax=Acaulospora colombiana TaxID=27376 RepID=A0ACA9JYS5_9GLOM|nr:10650_t:CDS:2 [Acaulospora colombiana]